MFFHSFRFLSNLLFIAIDLRSHEQMIIILMICLFDDVFPVPGRGVVLSMAFSNYVYIFSHLLMLSFHVSYIVLPYLARDGF